MASFTLTISDVLNEEAKIYAKKDKRSKNAYIEIALSEKIERDKKKLERTGGNNGSL